MISTESPQIPKTEQARILLIEDSDSNRYVISTWLRRAGHDVIEADTGASGLSLLSSNPVDLAICDINLPDMTGYMVCEQIKRDPRTRDVPVLHVSSTATQASDRSEGLRRGAEGYLVEPVESEELLATVEALLRGANAQRRAAGLAQRLRQLNDSTFALNQATNLEELFSAICVHGAILFDSTAFAVMASESRVRVAAAEPGAPVRLRDCAFAVLEKALAATASRTPIPAEQVVEIVGTAAQPEEYLAIEFGDEESHLGALLVGLRPENNLLLDEAFAVLRQYARAANTIMRNLYSYNIERRIALTLQKNLLPEAAPKLPGLQISACYTASEAHAEVGGDFYEIFALSEDKVIVAIGDVVGHSLEAAAVMAQLRTGIRCYALEGRSPSQILARLNRVLAKFHPEVTATAVCLRYDTKTGACEIANAGHLPPLHLSGGNSSFLPLGGTLLGVARLNVPKYKFAMKPDDVLILYTDGLVERRGENIDTGLQRLQTVVSGGVPLDVLCNRLIEEVGPAKAMDDIAVIAIRRLPPDA